MEAFFTKLFEWIWDLLEKYILPFIICRDYEAGVILRFGKYKRKLKRGLNFKWPLLEESLTCMKEAETTETPPKTITTKDGKSISVSFICRYKVIDERKFILLANDAISNIPHELTMAGCDYLTDCDHQEVIDKKSYTKIKNKANSEVEYMGIEFIKVGYSTNAITRPISLINN